MARSRDGVEIAYETHGGRAGTSAPAVVLVHGWAGNRTYWDNQIDFLAERTRSSRSTWRVMARSGLGRDDWNLPAFGDDVVAVVDEVGAQKVALVGHSMGGDAVLFAARQLGDRVVGLVWVDVFRSLGDESASSPEEVDAFLAPFRDDFAGAVDRFARSMFPGTADAELVDRIATDMAAAPREAALGSLRLCPQPRAGDPRRAPRITAPIVAINPDIAPTDVDSLRRHGVEPNVLQDVGHFLMIEDPEQFNPVLAATLASFER